MPQLGYCSVGGVRCAASRPVFIGLGVDYGAVVLNPIGAKELLDVRVRPKQGPSSRAVFDHNRNDQGIRVNGAAREAGKVGAKRRKREMVNAMSLRSTNAKRDQRLSGQVIVRQNGEFISHLNKVSRKPAAAQSARSE